MEQPISLQSTMCFERVIGIPPGCIDCFTNSISPEAVQRFKDTAYRLVSDYSLNHSFNRKDKFIITLAHRGVTASRHINNINDIHTILLNEFNNNQYEVRLFDTTTALPYKGYAEQIRIVAQSNVVITEHGAFESNMIYMRNSSLLVDMRGSYSINAYNQFASLAQLFGVYLVPVTTSNLVWHGNSDGFNVTTNEVNAVVDIIYQYQDFMLNSNNNVFYS